MITESRLPRTQRKLRNFVMLGASVAAIIAASVFGTASAPAGASSHREAPLIARDMYADNTDTYAFVSPDKPDTVTLIASWMPFEHPMGGPNYYGFGDDVGYYIYVDDNGDAKPDYSYKLTTKTTVKNPNTFLYNTAPMSGVGSDGQNMQQTWSLQENGKEIATGIVPPPNVGIKSTPNYLATFAAGVKTANTPEGPMEIFAGQTERSDATEPAQVFAS